jgi:hypothetical protein
MEHLNLAMGTAPADYCKAVRFYRDVLGWGFLK